MLCIIIGISLIFELPESQVNEIRKVFKVSWEGESVGKLGTPA